MSVHYFVDAQKYLIFLSLNAAFTTDVRFSNSHYPRRAGASGLRKRGSKIQNSKENKYRHGPPACNRAPCGASGRRPLCILHRHRASGADIEPDMFAALSAEGKRKDMWWGERGEGAGKRRFLLVAPVSFETRIASPSACGGVFRQSRPPEYHIGGTKVQFYSVHVCIVVRNKT